MSDLRCRPAVASSPRAAAAARRLRRRARDTTPRERRATVAVTLTDAGCEPADAQASPAGPTTFEVTNDGADAVTEFEVLDGDAHPRRGARTSPRPVGQLLAHAQAGRRTRCTARAARRRAGTLDRHRRRRRANADTAADGSAVDRLPRATSTRKTDELVAHDDAVRRRGQGRRRRAGQGSCFPAARAPYERIEPVAESFGDLDPEIDARADDVPAAEWTRLPPHRAGAVGRTTRPTAWPGRRQAARRREDAAGQGRRRVDARAGRRSRTAPSSCSSEVATSKITGEEERYSHTDLFDFEANVDGRQGGVRRGLEPILPQAHDPALASDDRRSASPTVDGALGTVPERHGFVPTRR